MADRFPTTGHFEFISGTTGDVDRFIYNGPLETDGTLPNNSSASSSVNREWNWSLDGTPSADVGPTSGEVAGTLGFLWPEASSPAAANDLFYLELEDSTSPGNPQIFDASSQSWVVEFSTNQRGDGNDAECTIETNENAAGWVQRGTIFGGSADPNKVATAGVQIWARRSVDLSALVSNASTRIRIRIELLGATIWNADYGLGRIAYIGTDLVDRAQEGYRWRNNDGSETTATWAENQDTEHLTNMYVPVGDEYEIVNQDSLTAINDTLDAAYQSFTGQGDVLSSVILYLQKVGTPAGSMTVAIYAHSGTYGTTSEPTGAALATSVALNADLELDPHWHTVEFIFDNTVTLSNGTNYVLYLEYTTGTATDYIEIAIDASTPVHAGNFGTNNGVTNTPVAGSDAIFRVVEGRQEKRLRILTDYTGLPPSEAASYQYKETGDPDTEWVNVVNVNT